MEGEITQVEETEDSKVVDVIPVQIVDEDSYKNIVDITSHGVRAKYYKQTYRPAWEQMPDFAGWLKGVEGEPTRAFCIYCQKTLHAHRLSLLKHTCTIRHQKAAQLHQMKKKKYMKSRHETEVSILSDDLNTGDDLENEEEDEMVEFSENHLDIEETEENNINEIDHEQLEDVEDSEAMQIQQNISDSLSQDDSMSPISTKVIDAMRGVPISGLQVSLYKLIDGRWTYINEGFTSHSGTFSKFMDGLDFTPGRYKLHYDVDRYFESRKQESLYPFIEVVFDHRGRHSNYHIPLVLSANSYTTYKG